MLGFKNRAKEESKVQETVLNQDINADFQSQNKDWFADYNLGSNDISNTEEAFNNNVDNMFDTNIETSENVIEGYKPLNSFGFDQDEYIDEEVQVSTTGLVQRKNSARRKIELSTRTKIHLTIYATLVLLIFSILIANAVIASTAMNVSADQKVEKFDNSDLNTLVLPNGESISINDDISRSESTKTSFDKFCDNLEE